MGFDAAYETERIKNEGAFYRKMRMKRRLYPFFGELYVGKRAKLRHFRRWFAEMKLPAGANVLEVGSGDGVFCFDAARSRRDLHVTGLELNPIEARVCQRIVEEDRIGNLHFAAGLLGPQHWTSRFDFIFCLDVLEHVKEDVALMREMLDALKPGGTLLIHVPHRTQKNLDGSIAEIADEDAWKVNPGHVRNGYFVEELEGRLVQAGFAEMRSKRVSGWHIARALQIHERHPGFGRRLLILPWLDYHIRRDVRVLPADGNGVWCWAKRPAG